MGTFSPLRFTDIDGRQPHWDDYLDRVIGEILDAGTPSQEEKLC